MTRVIFSVIFYIQTIIRMLNVEILVLVEIFKVKFKIVYIAPMKALAAEMANNFGKR